MKKGFGRLFNYFLINVKKKKDKGYSNRYGVMECCYGCCISKFFVGCNGLS